MLMTTRRTASASADFDDFERKMKQVSADFNDWLSVKEDPCMTYVSEPTSLAFRRTYTRGLWAVSTQYSFEPSIGDQTDADASNGSSSGSRRKKRVSWGQEVEIREYRVIQGDHPNCSKFPLTLDWEHAVVATRDISASPERRSSYQKPRRLNLEDRRRRLFGDVEENLQDFAAMDADLDALMRDLDDCLTQSDMPAFSSPLLLIEPKPQHPPVTPSMSFFTGSCFETPQVDEAPIVRWQRITE